jgi:hypothetical protein
MAKPPEKVFWSEEEKLALVMRAIELRLHKMWDSPLHVLRASMTALPADRRRNVCSLAEAPWFVELHDKTQSARLIRHNVIGSEILAAMAEGWRMQHEAWTVQHTSVREAVHELKSQMAILREILDLLRSRNHLPSRPIPAQTTIMCPCVCSNGKLPLRPVQKQKPGLSLRSRPRDV